MVDEPRGGPVVEGTARPVARARARRGDRDDPAVVLANVDRTTADLAAATLLSYGIDARALADPAHGNARAPVTRASPVHGVVVRTGELALARDVLRRSADDMPAGFRDDDIEEWSAERAALHRRGTGPMVQAGAIAAAIFVLVVLVVGGVVAALT